MNEKDKKRIREMLEGYGFSFAPGLAVTDNLAAAIGGLLTVAHVETRAATLKDIRRRVETVNPQLGFGSANGSVMKKYILTEIEAAANSEEGAGDGLGQIRKIMG